MLDGKLYMGRCVADCPKGTQKWMLKNMRHGRGSRDWGHAQPCHHWRHTGFATHISGGVLPTSMSLSPGADGGWGSRCPCPALSSPGVHGGWGSHWQSTAHPRVVVRSTQGV